MFEILTDKIIFEEKKFDQKVFDEMRCPGTKHPEKDLKFIYQADKALKKLLMETFFFIENLTQFLVQWNQGQKNNFGKSFFFGEKQFFFSI